MTSRGRVVVRSWPRPAVAASLIVLALGCGGDGTTAPREHPIPPDAGPAPEITALDMSPADGVEPGARTTVHYVVRAGTPLRRLRFFRTGAYVAADSIGARGARALDDTISFATPASASPGESLTLRVEAVDTLGRVGTRTAAPVPVVDHIAPVLSAAAGDVAAGWGQPSLDSIVRSESDTLVLKVLAQDNHALAWVGYRLGGPAATGDSVGTSGTALQPSFTIPLRSAWVGDLPLTIFARDAVGNESVVTGKVHVYPVAHRRVRVASLAAEVGQMLYDGPRQRIYVTRADTTNVAVLSLASLAWETPIALPGVPARIELTPGGDSLLVLFADRPALAIVDLRAPTPSVSTIDILAEAAQGRIAGGIAAAANGTAIVVMRPPTFDVGSAIVSVDLATGVQTLRETGGVIGDHTMIAMGESLDRQKVAMHFWPSCPRLYVASSDQFTDCAPALFTSGDFTGDANGSTFLLANQLLDGDLRQRSTLTAPHITGNISALSADGQVAYFSSGDVSATGHGFAKIRTSDGVMLEQQELPIVPEKILLASDGSLLFAQGRECTQIGPNSFGCGPLKDLYLVDLR